jgi:hypothetical protein
MAVAFRGALRTAAFCLALTLAAGGGAGAACRDDVIDVRGGDAAARFTIEVARTEETRARGLMFRETLAADHGMLFIFDPPRDVAFWMRNTPLPLDIIYIDLAGAVVRITENTVPFSETPLPSGATVAAVLEINAGLSRRLGIAPGAQMRHPAFAGAGALWPCGG